MGKETKVAAQQNFGLRRSSTLLSIRLTTTAVPQYMVAWYWYIGPSIGPDVICTDLSAKWA